MPESQHSIIDRYRKWRSQSIVSEFIAGGGKICLATEGQPALTIRSLYHEGHTLFAEKFVKELELKKSLLSDLVHLQIHYYGRIQSNKIKKIIQSCDLIESLSLEHHAEKVAAYFKDTYIKRELFIQVNTGKEPQKLGLEPGELDSFVEHCLSLELPVVGLMCIPPITENPKKHFAMLRKLADRNNLTHCQMGSSRDYQIAIDYGATCIRIGKLIFQPSFL